MQYTSTDKTKAIAIVSVFETGRAFGDFAAVAVLTDGAGVSYGVSQFTHRSGSLAKVIERYLAAGGTVGGAVLNDRLAPLRRTTAASIKKLSNDTAFKAALRAAGVTREMKEVQLAVAFELYLEPAVRVCEQRGFTTPLALAVIYDSIVHGSFERIASRIDAHLGEREWIAAYVRRRHAWLSRVARLKATTYRTRFFLAEIERGNWLLDLPLNVHGVRVTRLPEFAIAAVPTTDILQTGQDVLATAAERFDRVEAAVTTVTSRRDAAKSLWTTVAGSVTQILWAVFGWMAGIPREVWIVVAVIAASLLLLYLWRQIELGRIREQRSEPPA